MTQGSKYIIKSICCIDVHIQMVHGIRCYTLHEGCLANIYIYISIFERYKYKYVKRVEYALIDCEVSKEWLLKMADSKIGFEICAHEHAIVREC